jgi:hypothetical protein
MTLPAQMVSVSSPNEWEIAFSCWREFLGHSCEAKPLVIWTYRYWDQGDVDLFNFWGWWCHQYRWYWLVCGRCRIWCCRVLGRSSRGCCDVKNARLRLAARNQARQLRTQRWVFQWVHLGALCGQPGAIFFWSLEHILRRVSFRSSCCVNVRTGRVYLCFDMHNLRRSKSERNRTARDFHIHS